jgi:putative SOS response-associated peptidase YedK
VCGRLGIYLIPGLVAQLFRAGYAPDPRVDIEPTWNLTPSQDTMVVLRDPETGMRRLELLRWGFLPRWAKDPMHTRRPINARGETVTTSSLFRDAFAKRRCLVPASNFYEWKSQPGQRQKQPYAIARADGKPLALAGLWEAWHDSERDTDLRTFTIVTTEANGEMAQVHNRMPVILEESDWPAWLGEAEGDPKSLLRPAPEGILGIWPVSRKVNSPANNGPDLLVTIGELEQTDLALR